MVAATGARGGSGEQAVTAYQRNGKTGAAAGRRRRKATSSATLARRNIA